MTLKISFLAKTSLPYPFAALICVAVIKINYPPHVPFYITSLQHFTIFSPSFQWIYIVKAACNNKTELSKNAAMLFFVTLFSASRITTHKSLKNFPMKPQMEHRKSSLSPFFENEKNTHDFSNYVSQYIRYIVWNSRWYRLEACISIPLINWDSTMTWIISYEWFLKIEN